MKKKKGDGKKLDLPQISEKYQNMNKLEETENRLQEERFIIESLKKENMNLFGEVKEKELDIVKI